MKYYEVHSTINGSEFVKVVSKIPFSKKEQAQAFARKKNAEFPGTDHRIWPITEEEAKKNPLVAFTHMLSEKMEAFGDDLTEEDWEYFERIFDEISEFVREQ